ncbi:tape measure protein [Corynebacterium sp. YIM 101645]|uniref:Tape measure protein n=1 Tax=Corynebacterium lemuris TaxID=1859292 RepID=A0ABT2G0X4_9CORY|nr:tape measure protein [Corynebacterium lemuris]MCS5479839.1 tape measure protein [Corynebacterium lemuris]
MPVVPSLRNFKQLLDKQMLAPMEQASKQAGAAMEKSLTESSKKATDTLISDIGRRSKAEAEAAKTVAAADKTVEAQKLRNEAATKAVTIAEKAHERAVLDAASKQRAAQDALLKLKESGKATTEQLAAAEEKVTTSRLQGSETVERREMAIAKAKAASIKAAGDLEDAERKAKKARDEHADASDNLVAAEKRFEKAQDGTNDSVKKAEDLMRDFRSELDKTSTSMHETAEKSGGLGSKILDGLGTIGKGALLGVGAQIGSTVTEGIGTAFSKGFGRLQSIEQAETMLSGLGHSAEGVAGIMDDAMASVTGTAFGFGEAASMAATFAGAGIEQGEDLQRILTLVGDTAAITGSDFNEMGSIWTKVATGQKLQTTEMNQLMDRGIGLLPELQKHYGVTAEEARKMVTEGKVGFEDFSEVMEGMVGGSAQLMGETFSGSAANMQAALGRLGAQLMSPIYENSPAIFAAIGGAVDKLGEHLGPLIEQWSEKLGPYLEDFAANLGPWLESSIDDIAGKIGELVKNGRELVAWGKENRDWIEPLAVSIGVAASAWMLWTAAIKGWQTATKIATGIQAAFNAVMAVNPIMLGVIAITALTAGLVYFFTKTETGQKLWESFTTKIGEGIDWVSEKWSAFTGWFSTAWEGITALAQGDFTAQFREAFGLEEDNPLIAGFLKFRDILTSIPETIQGIIDILFRGDYTSAPFGLGEDSKLVDWLFTIREGFIKAGEVISTVWNGIITVGQYAIAIIGTVVLTPLMLLWHALSESVRIGWEKVIKPVWDIMSVAALAMYENYIRPALEAISHQWDVLQLLIATAVFGIRMKIAEFQEAVMALWLEYVQPVLDWISEKWELLSLAMTAAWEIIRTSVFDAWEWYTERVRANWEMATGAMVSAWEWTRDTFVAVWEWIKAGVFDAWSAVLEALQPAFEAAISFLSDRWSALSAALHRVWTWIDQNVFAPLGVGLDTVQGWFQAAVDGIGRIWDGLRAAAAKPARFVLETVWNHGILAAWNKIAEFLPGIDTKDPVSLGELGKYAQGGVLPGWSPGADIHTFVSPTGGRIHLSGGEAIMRPEWTQAVGGPAAVDRMNRAAMTGQLDPDQMRVGHSHAFANGGVWDLGRFALGGVLITTAVQHAMRDIVKAKYPNISLTSATRPGHSGYHGTGHATDWSNGFGNTPMQLALAHDIAQTYPGSAQLIYAAPGWASNIYEGGPAGAMDSGIYKTAQAGRHDNHVHWAMTQAPTMQFGGGVFEGGNNGGGLGAAVFNWIADRARGIWETMVSPVSGLINGKMGEWGDSSFAEIPEKIFDHLRDTAWGYLAGLFGRGGGSDSGSVDVSDITGPVVDQVEQVFARHGFTGADWDAAKWIVQRESTWNPTAVNPSSGAFGLFQFNPMGGNTLGAYLPDRNPDPAVQADAGARYMKDRYGSPSAAKAFWEQNGWYAQGGVLPSKLGLYDTGGWLPHGGLAFNASGSPEPVFNAEQWSDIRSLINAVADLHPELRRMVDELTPQLEAMVVQLGKISDHATVEGITARAVANRVLDMDVLAYSDSMKTIMAAEAQIIEARASHADRLQGIVDREHALADAQKELEEIMNSSGDMSVQNARKLADAEKAVQEAKTKAAEAEGDKQAAAAEKVADAEEKLRRVREDVAADADKDAAKRDEEIAKATDKVTKAETDLLTARQESVKALDHIILPDTVGGLIPQIGQAATAIGGAVPEVSAALAGLAATALPAGISLGVALTALQSALDVAREIWGILEDLQNWVSGMRTAQAKLWHETLSSIAAWNQMVDDQRQTVGALQQQLINDQISLMHATWNLRTAQADQVRAQLEGVRSVAEAEAALQAERDRVNRAAMWDFEDLSLAYDRYRWMQKIGIEELVRDVATITPEILALQHEVNAAKLLAEMNQRQAALATLTATWEQHKASIALMRTQENLAAQSEKLARMSGTQFGMNTGEAMTFQEIARLSAETARLQGEKDSLGSRGRGFLGGLFDWDGDGKIFGIFDNPWSQEQQGYDAAIAANQRQIDQLLQSQYANLSQAEIADMERIINMAAAQYAAGREAAGDAIIAGSWLGDAQRAQEMFEFEDSVSSWENAMKELQNSIDDTRASLEYETELQALREQIAALQAAADSEQYRADAWREENAEVRAALEALADFSADNARAISRGKPVTINITGEGLTAEQVAELIEQLNDEYDDLDLRVQRVEESGQPTALEVMAALR